MTENRYYKKDWEESYYIFDSNTISEDEFEEKVEYEGYDVFADSLTSKEVIDLLNENVELKKQMRNTIEMLKMEKETAISENERIRLDFAINVLHGLLELEKELKE